MRITFANHEFILDSSGALFWPLRQTLVIADAHLEKGSFFARRGFHLPPYDSHITLTKLVAACQKLGVRRLIILGDFFHDNEAHKRLSSESLAIFQSLQKFPLIWVKGNHDVGYKPQGIEVYDEYEEDGLCFRHEALKDSKNEISGHFHPKAELVYKGKSFRDRCFIEDSRKLMLPAFGAYTGGLSTDNDAISRHFIKPIRRYIIINERIVYIGDDVVGLLSE